MAAKRTRGGPFEALRTLKEELARKGDEASSKKAKPTTGEGRAPAASRAAPQSRAESAHVSSESEHDEALLLHRSFAGVRPIRPGSGARDETDCRTLGGRRTRRHEDARLGADGRRRRSRAPSRVDRRASALRGRRRRTKRRGQETRSAARRAAPPSARTRADRRQARSTRPSRGASTRRARVFSPHDACPRRAVRPRRARQRRPLARWAGRASGRNGGLAIARRGKRARRRICNCDRARRRPGSGLRPPSALISNCFSH